MSSKESMGLVFYAWVIPERPFHSNIGEKKQHELFMLEHKEKELDAEGKWKVWFGLEEVKEKEQSIRSGAILILEPHP